MKYILEYFSDFKMLKKSCQKSLSPPKKYVAS